MSFIPLFSLSLHYEDNFYLVYLKREMKTITNIVGSHLVDMKNT